MDAPRRPFILPRKLIEAAEHEQRSAWLSTLSGTVARLAHAWSITVGTPFEPGGQTAWVAPARDRAGNDLVLKVA
jgi:streptomycin 6-kinase